MLLGVGLGFWVGLLPGLAGGTTLALVIPVLRLVVLTFGSPELFMVAMVGIGCIGSLSGEGRGGLRRGFLAGGLGLLCAMVGQDPQAGILRYSLGLLYLWDGHDIVPVLVGIFAIPEIIDLAVRGTAIAGDVSYGRLVKGVTEGSKDTFRHFVLTIRCRLIGPLIGIMPGLGGG